MQHKKAGRLHLHRRGVALLQVMWHLPSLVWRRGCQAPIISGQSVLTTDINVDTVTRKILHMQLAKSNRFLMVSRVWAADQLVLTRAADQH